MKMITQKSNKAVGFWTFEKVSIYFLFVVFVASFFGIINGSTRDEFVSMAEMFLWVVAFFCLYFVLKDQQKLNSYKIQLWLIISFVLSFLLQIMVFNLTSIDFPLFQLYLLGSDAGVSFLNITLILVLLNSLSILAAWQIAIALVNFATKKFQKLSLSKVSQTLVIVILGSLVFLLAKFLNQISLIEKALNLTDNTSFNSSYEYYSLSQIIIFNLISFLTSFVLIGLGEVMSFRVKSIFLKYWFILQLLFILSLAFLL